ncbi:hypothetical protein CHS0354_008286 [Potamilus streckersoni]|uniref:SH2 domain-containing protein n=1 Tax=Potamilus streckersoni TaxID=2493646 RepID=A0AAE0SJ85_9BIVA|nr:hypothetical protein CHS0354_008286 [Potamilus streckersoni]
MPSQGKSVLPPPPGGRRAPPPPPAESEEAPPPLPSRPTPGKPGGGQSRNGPLSPSASSDSSFQDEEYEEPGTQVSSPPPPLPPHPNVPKSIKQPSHQAVEEPNQEEEYSELDGVGMVEQGLPSPTTEEPEQEAYDEFELGIRDEENVEEEAYEAPENQQDTYEEVPSHGQPAAPKHPPASSKVGVPLPAPPASSNKNAGAPVNKPQETYESVPGQSQPSVPTRLPPSSGKTGVPLPPPPASEFIDQISGDTYETLPDQGNRTPTPPPPPPSVPSQRRPVPPPSTLASEESKPEVPDRSKQEIPKIRAASGMPVIGQDQLNSARMGLKQTNSKSSILPSKQEETVQSQGDFRSTLEKFKHKEQDVGQHKAESFSEQAKTYPTILKPKPVMVVSSFSPPLPPATSRVPSTKKQTEAQTVARPKSPTVENDNGWDQEEIYDDALSKPQDPLNGHKWFKDVERQQANSMVKAKNVDGAYMVRTSSGKETDQPYSLVVLYKNHVYNLKIRHKKDGRYALGEEKSDELTFKDVPDLIQHHTKQAVMLVNNKENKQYETILTVYP